MNLARYSVALDGRPDQTHITMLFCSPGLLFMILKWKIWQST
jgi:hypothetical protein